LKIPRRTPQFPPQILEARKGPMSTTSATQPGWRTKRSYPREMPAKLEADESPFGGEITKVERQRLRGAANRKSASSNTKPSIDDSPKTAAELHTLMFAAREGEPCPLDAEFEEIPVFQGHLRRLP
jgi:hypothetical protein